MIYVTLISEYCHFYDYYLMEGNHENGKQLVTQDNNHKNGNIQISESHKSNSINSIKTIDLLTSERFKYKDMSENAYEACTKAKKKHRSEIKPEEWKKYNYFYSDWCERTLENLPFSKLKIEEERFENLSLEEFREKYERINIPVKIIGGLDDWKALESWTFDVN